MHVLLRPVFFLHVHVMRQCHTPTFSFNSIHYVVNTIVSPFYYQLKRLSELLSFNNKLLQNRAVVISGYAELKLKQSQLMKECEEVQCIVYV